MEDIHKILQLVANHAISPEEAVAIFDLWKKQGKQIRFDSFGLDLDYEDGKIEENKPEFPKVFEIGDKDKTREILSKELVALVATILKMNKEEISIQTPIQNYGINSVAAAGVTGHFSEKYKIPLTPPMIFEVQNLNEFLGVLMDQFYHQIADYYRESEAPIPSVQDDKISIPGVAFEDNQNITHAKAEALFIEEKCDLDSMWMHYAKEEMGEEKIECNIQSEKSVTGDPIIIVVKNEIVEFKSFGNGEPLLLIGDLGCSETLWQSLLPSLIKEYHVLIYFPPGHGKSTLVKSFNKISDIATLLKEGLEHRNIPMPISVVGHSLGGAIALEMALKYPDKIKALTLISTSQKSHVEANIFQKASNEFDKIQHLVKHASDLMPYSKPEMIEYYKVLLKNFDLSAELSKIICPTTIFCGKEDEYISHEDSKMIHREIKNSELIEFEHTGHFSMLTHAEDISRKIRK